jgi:hypothetical protein
MLAKESPEIDYKEVRELLVHPKKIMLMDEVNKMTICAFMDKYISKIYGIHKINSRLSKKKGYTFFDLMTISDIAYTLAVLENSHEVWDQEYKKKRMSAVEWAQYRISDDYTSTKPKFTDRKGKKREYCDSGWSKEGKEFYNGVYQKWKVIAFKNDVCVWSNLEEEWASYAEDNNFGNGYRRKKMRLDTAPIDGYETQQVEDMPNDRFCMMGEIEDCPWKVNGRREVDDDSDDDDDGYGSSPNERAMDGNQRLPRVSTDYEIDMDIPCMNGDW